MKTQTFWRSNIPVVLVVAACVVVLVLLTLWK